MDVTTVSDPVNLLEFLEEWKDATDAYDLDHETVLDFKDYAMLHMPNTDEMMADLESECSLETLSSESDPKELHLLLKTIPAAGLHLATLGYQNSELEARNLDVAYKNKVLDRLKYRGRDGPWKHRVYNRDDPDSHQLVQFPDVLLNVQVYRPYQRKRCLILDQEFNVLGQQGLTELRDKILCASDYIAIGDFNRNPDHPSDFLTKDLYKSGFFYIEGTFYNDMRDPSTQDYSKVIIDWSKITSHKVGPFQTQLMETTRFIDLTIRLGQPYLYMHQGDCEHLVIFSDIRVTHQEDCRYLDKYPIPTYKSRERKPKCRICQQNLARWVTYGSPLTPEDPCFFCDTCFRALHYDNENKMLVSNVTVYPYPDIRKMMANSVLSAPAAAAGRAESTTAKTEVTAASATAELPTSSFAAAETVAATSS